MNSTYSEQGKLGTLSILKTPFLRQKTNNNSNNNKKNNYVWFKQKCIILNNCLEFFLYSSCSLPRYF